MPRVSVRHSLGLAAAGMLIVGTMSGCSTSTTSPIESETPSPSMTTPSASASGGGGESTVAFDKKIQEELAAVGCHPGAVDGIIGPQTDAAIVAFQQAAGLEVDGELGPETDEALKSDVQEGKTVCTGSSTPTSSPTSTGKAPCTATAISSALKQGETLLKYICTDVAAERWAAGQQSAGPDVSNFFMQAKGSEWVLVPNDQVCGTASAGLPQELLDYCGLT